MAAMSGPRRPRAGLCCYWPSRPASPWLISLTFPLLQRLAPHLSRPGEGGLETVVLSEAPSVKAVGITCPPPRPLSEPAAWASAGSATALRGRPRLRDNMSCRLPTSRPRRRPERIAIALGTQRRRASVPRTGTTVIAPRGTAETRTPTERAVFAIPPFGGRAAATSSDPVKEGSWIARHRRRAPNRADARRGNGRRTRPTEYSKILRYHSVNGPAPRSSVSARDKRIRNLDDPNLWNRRSRTK